MRLFVIKKSNPASKTKKRQPHRGLSYLIFIIEKKLFTFLKPIKKGESSGP
ncbi:hypothetical protein GCWU000246_01383 [Jonquetella anthropi E3_33 E1]|nr:hypothetical protein GCWU000246_01383 [Jonquetella anthropi E3_33 E1]